MSTRINLQAADHAEQHRTGGGDPLTGEVGINVLPYNINGENVILTDPGHGRKVATGAYTKTSQISLTKTPDTIKIGFSAWINTAGTGYARIYRNGAAVGTERAVTGVYTPAFFSEDISGWSDGDLLQLYARHSTDYIYSTGFGVYGKTVSDMYGTID